jgi:hypothetical protein
MLSVGDKIFLDFFEYAGTTREDLKDVDRREELKAKCEAAGNEIIEEIFQFWSQNNALEVLIEIDNAKPKDPALFNKGMVADIRIKNINHKATLPLSERSAGFVWFFSFLAQFRQLKKTPGNGNAIILLDEPGLTLHGKAQGDLMRFMVERLLPDHQVIFTTHSPFPLQSALSYEVTQSRFIGASSWLVERPSDIVYLQVVSQALVRRGRVGLDPKWTLYPSGGIDRIAPFMRMFGGNRINVAVLSDIAVGDKTKIARRGPGVRSFRSVALAPGKPVCA